jgi:hypothetical protein
MNNDFNSVPPELDAGHFQVLKEAPAPNDFRGHKPRNFARQIGAPEDIIGQLPEEPFTRPTLVAFVAAERDVETQFVAVMSWGKMRHDSGRRAWQVKERWAPLIREIEGPGLSRSDAYALFKLARANRNTRLNGLGVAYFTKLLFFLRPVANAYIMDQWTGKSINLLFRGAKTVRFSAAAVSDQNTEADYDCFCERIEFVAKQLGVEPAEAEKRIFSNGGRQLGHWRAYVKRLTSHTAVQT